MNSGVFALAACNPNAPRNLAKSVGVDTDNSIVEIAGHQAACGVEESLADIADRAGLMEPVLVSEISRIAAGAQKWRRRQAANARERHGQVRPFLGDGLHRWIVQQALSHGPVSNESRSGYEGGGSPHESSEFGEEPIPLGLD